MFAEVVDITGVVLTKLDGTAKGGIVFRVQQELGVPVKLVGLGEGPDDLAPFEPAAFVDALARLTRRAAHESRDDWVNTARNAIRPIRSHERNTTRVIGETTTQHCLWPRSTVPNRGMGEGGNWEWTDFR